MDSNLLPVKSISKDDNISMVAIKNLPNKPGAAYSVFGLLAENEIDVDIILQSISESHTNAIIFTVRSAEAEHTKSVLNDHLPSIGADEIIISSDVAKIAIAGVGMKGTPGVAAAVFRALYDSDVDILHISTSEIKISLLVHEKDADKALNALYQKFDLSAE